MRKLLVPLMILSSSSFACELTPEYRELRVEIVKEIREPYNSCNKATHGHFFTKQWLNAKRKVEGKILVEVVIMWLATRSHTMSLNMSIVRF